jgi:hypothetical protein
LKRITIALINYFLLSALHGSQLQSRLYRIVFFSIQLKNPPDGGFFL